METGPSISRNNKALSFIRNIKANDRDMPWQLIPFVSQNIQKDEWASPQKITIRELKTNEEVNAFYFDSENGNVFFSSGLSQNNWGNYYGLLKDSVCVNVKKMDFKGGYITWISKDYKTG